MLPDRFTELFFLDEATAFAAGHRQWVVVDAGLLRWTTRSMRGSTTSVWFADPERSARRLTSSGRRALSTGSTRVITPPSLVSVLRSGWRPLVPMLHPSAS